MEEWAGQVWHKWITRAASKEYREQAVLLENIKSKLAIQFRAFGGKPSLQLLGVSRTEWHNRRSWLKRVASSFNQVEMAWCDDSSVRLPEHLAWYPQRKLNEQHYLWLTCLAAHNNSLSQNNWIVDNQTLVQKTLNGFPGLRSIYESLVSFHLTTRPRLTSLKGKVALQEQWIQKALLNPGSVNQKIDSPQALAPVLLWLHPNPPVQQGLPQNLDEPQSNSKHANSKELSEKRRRKGEWVKDKDGKEGLLAFRLESVFSWSEFIPVDRTADDDDEDHAEAVADDLDVLSISRSQDTPASKLKFDLDLPALDQDDIILKSGILLPEWDYRRGTLKKDFCSLQEMLPKSHEMTELPHNLRAKAKKLRAHFEMLATGKQWLRAQPEGSEIDLDRFVIQTADSYRGFSANREDLYRELRIKLRNLSCLLLADLSLSTDAWVSNKGKVIDVIRESLFLFGESLEAVGDRFAIAGFSSKKRSHIRYYPLKNFNEPWNPVVKGKIRGIEPGYYTRMGAAIRHASQTLLDEKTETRLLLLLTDGKPNDLDHYEGRYGVEDTRQAIKEAREKGLRVFCVTIDEKGEQYLPYIFGQRNFILVRNAEELPTKLTRLYTAITA